MDGDVYVTGDQEGSGGREDGAHVCQPPAVSSVETEVVDVEVPAPGEGWPGGRGVDPVSSGRCEGLRPRRPGAVRGDGDVVVQGPPSHMVTEESGRTPGTSHF